MSFLNEIFGSIACVPNAEFIRRVGVSHHLATKYVRSGTVDGFLGGWARESILKHCESGGSEGLGGGKLGRSVAV